MENDSHEPKRQVAKPNKPVERPGWDPFPNYKPDFAVRVLCWVGIYLCGALPTSLLLMNPAGLIIFPWGLAALLNSLLPRSWNSGPEGPGFAWAYGFYVCHFILSLIVPTRRAFRIMMIVLLIVVALNLATCADMLISKRAE